MDWEQKFSSIVRETESNLAKVKQRLSSTRGSPGTFAHLPSTGSPIPFPASTFDSIADVPVTDAAVLDRGTHDLARSPGVLALLTDKIEAQTTMLETLNRAVRLLEEERDGYQRQVGDLKDEVSVLRTRVAERGVDLRTEEKLETWRRDVASQIEALQTQLRDAGVGAGASHASDLVRELHDMKRTLQDEMNLIRRDVESLRSRIMRVEVDVASFDCDNRDMNRRHDRMEQNLLQLRERQKLTSSLPAEILTASVAAEGATAAAASRRPPGGGGVALFSPPDGATPANQQVAELKTSLKLLENKLANVETQLDRRNRKDTSDLSPASSDLDLSDLSLDDLTPNPDGGKLGLDSDDEELDLGLTSDDLLSTGVDTDDLITK